MEVSTESDSSFHHSSYVSFHSVFSSFDPLQLPVLPSLSASFCAFFIHFSFFLIFCLPLIYHLSSSLCLLLALRLILGLKQGQSFTDTLHYTYGRRGRSKALHIHMQPEREMKAGQ